MRTASIALLLLALAGAGGPAQAQTEAEAARASLAGIDGFELVVEVEAGVALMVEDALDVAQLQAAAAQRLAEAGLRVVRPSASTAPAQLYLHVNALDAGRGLVPFAVKAQCRQRVHLARDATLTVPAATWHQDAVGLVTHDQIDGITEAALGLVDAFILDVQAVTP